MNFTSINVVQTHSLGADEALSRLKRLLAEVSTDSAFVVKRLTWDDDSKLATFTLDVGVGSVSGRAKVSDGYVQVETDKLPMVAWGFIAGYAHRRIEAALQEALS